MDFTEFANRLRDIIGGTDNTAAFTKSLFETVTDDTDALKDVSTETYKSYFNGNTSISRLAKKLLPRMSMEGFIEYIEQFEGDTLQRLADAFEKDIPDINACNVAVKLSEQFETIIKAAARKKRKAPTPPPAESTMSADQEEIINNMKAGLLAFAQRADEVVHEMAEKSRENKRKHAEEQAQYEKIDGEVVDDDEPEQAKDSSGNTTIIQHQTNVIQNGDNNSNITNNGTININL